MGTQGTDDDRIRLLERSVERLTQQVETFGRLAQLGAPRSPRLCYTCDPPTGTYLTPDSVSASEFTRHLSQRAYYFKFLNASFGANDTPASYVLSTVDRQTTANAWGYSLGHQYIPKDTLCAAFLDGPARQYGATPKFQWWLVPLPHHERFTGTATNEQQINSTWLGAGPWSANHVGFSSIGQGGNILISRAGWYQFVATGLAWWSSVSPNIVDVGEVFFEFSLGTFSGSFSPWFDGSAGQLLAPTMLPAVSGHDLKATVTFAITTQQAIAAGTLVDLRVRRATGSTTTKLSRQAKLTIHRL